MRGFSIHVQGINKSRSVPRVHVPLVEPAHDANHSVRGSVSVMKPAQEKIEKIDQRLRIQPLRGGNLLYIT